jgi:hypothetical protein
VKEVLVFAVIAVIAIAVGMNAFAHHTRPGHSEAWKEGFSFAQTYLRYPPPYGVRPTCESMSGTAIYAVNVFPTVSQAAKYNAEYLAGCRAGVRSLAASGES